MPLPLRSWVVLLVVSREKFFQRSIGALTSSLALPKESNISGNNANVNADSNANVNLGVDVNENTITSTSTSSSKSIKSYLSFHDAMSIIQQHSPTEFIDAVLHTERFLYRGEEDVGSSLNNNHHHDCALMTPEPDLLLFDTYANNDALGYFEQLEKCSSTSISTSISTSTEKSFQVRPSNGHIGTSVISDAAVWGAPVSVWPVGSAFSYAYPRYRTLFFDEITTNPVKASTSTIGNSCRVDVEYDHDLTNALKMGKEIMFATLTFDAHMNINTRSSTTRTRGSGCSLSLDDSAFVAIPSKYDREILSILKP